MTAAHVAYVVRLRDAVAAAGIVVTRRQICPECTLLTFIWPQRTLAKIAEQVAAGRVAYNKFFAIGLFR